MRSILVTLLVGAALPLQPVLSMPLPAVHPSSSRPLPSSTQAQKGSAAALPTPAQAERTLRVAQWSDIHYGNPEHAPAAWQAAWHQTLAQHPDLVVLSGDLVDNKCTPAEFEARSEQFVGGLAHLLERLACPTVLALGNNDLPHNYQTDQGGLAQTLARYHRLLGRHCYLDALGNGVYPRQVGGTAWISLNSLFFSPLNRCGERAAQAEQTLSWLEAQLRRVGPSTPVVLVMHIPPTPDLYDHKSSWLPEAQRRFAAILAAHQGAVAIMGGHYHRNEVHALELPGQRAVPIFLAGSLCTKYGVHPTWRTYSVRETAQGELSRVAFNVRYPLDAVATSAWVLDHPCSSGALRTWSQHLVGGSSWYERYLGDLWGRKAGWQADCSSDETHRAVLSELWVRPWGADAGR
jgi:3',5'-cyclic AMP phosphodiesterase CpdA